MPLGFSALQSRFAFATWTFGFVCSSAVTCTSVACSNAVPQVAKGPHPASGGVWPLAVDSRPPPPQVQVVPPPPSSSCSWLDGEWTWQRNAWTWRDGGWVRVSEDCYYAESMLTWQGGPGSAGVLYFTPAEWYHRSLNERCAPAVACTR